MKSLLLLALAAIPVLATAQVQLPPTSDFDKARMRAYAQQREAAMDALTLYQAQVEAMQGQLAAEKARADAAEAKLKAQEPAKKEGAPKSP